jgi:membrane protease subunit (stomatin/prohibitin family)
VGGRLPVGDCLTIAHQPIKQRVMTSELLEIIEWNDDSRDTLTYRCPDHDRAIKRGAQLVVRESQAAQ